MSAAPEPETKEIKVKTPLAIKLKAWWGGVPVDAIINPPVGAETKNDSAPKSSLEYINVCELIWGKGRTSPIEEKLDLLFASSLAITKDKKLYLFGQEAGARAFGIINALDCKIDAYENNLELKKHIDVIVKKEKIKNYTSHIYDNKPGSLPKNKADALAFAYNCVSQEALEANIFSIARILKPNGFCVLVDFIARSKTEDVSKSIGNEMRSFVTEEDIINCISAAGLVIREEDDWSANFINMYFAKQNRIKDSLEEVMAKIIKSGGMGAANIALNEIICWRDRVEALKSGRLSIKKYLISKQ